MNSKLPPDLPHTTPPSFYRADGRLSRRSFMAWNALLALILWPLMAVLAQIILQTMPVDDMSSGAFSGIQMLITLAIFVFYAFAVYLIVIFSIKRLHDRNHTGWLVTLMFVPVVNFLFILYLLCAPGDQRVNSFGAIRSTLGWEKVLAWVYIVLMLLGFASAMFMGYWFGEPNLEPPL